MTKLNFIIVCDRAYITEPYGKLNIEGVFDTINSPSYPAIHPSMSVVVGVEVGEGRIAEKIILKKDGAQILNIPQTEINKLKPGKHRFIHNLLNVELTSEGKYTIEVYVNEALIGNAEIYAIKD